ncbi:hypothetical protein S58_34860 [Bradyrhizobium oligotrophicum S58]|uniref:Uncharacterized protein n=1 Tax=Bradyrhizobium oligotrophicum S58 TaxID=1245469 RepID=M4Z7G6_9BRAD|nr:MULTISPECIES: hypothetical protein [Bradyrhizobium]BAM89479.1 hypothetical protein S58_34860 [Bradyrhizobium oligotrophicum S58]
MTEGRIAIGALILFAGWLLIGLPWLVNPAERVQFWELKPTSQARSETPPRGTAESPFFVQVTPAPKSADEQNQEAADREEKRSSDVWLVRWTGLLFAATVGLIAATCVLGWYAYRQSKDTQESIALSRDSARAANQSAMAAEKAIIASNRAWIRIDAIGVGGQPLQFYGTGHPTGASMSISFKFTNIGNAPALSITPHAWLIAVKGGGPFPADVLESRCAEIRRQPIGPGFATLFPNEKFPEVLGLAQWDLNVSVSAEDLAEGLEISSSKNAVKLIVIGCIDYTFASDSSTHRMTSFMFDVVRGGLPTPIDPSLGSIPSGDLQLFLSSMGGRSIVE